MQHALRLPDASLRPATRPSLTNLCLLASDVVTLTVAGASAALFASVLGGRETLIWLVGLWPLLAIAPGIFMLTDLYPGAGTSPVDELRIIVTTLTGLAAVVVASMALFDHLTGRAILPVAAGWLVSVTAVPTARVLLRHVLAPRTWWGVPAIVLGAGKTAGLVVERLQRHAALNVKVVACLDDDPGKWGGDVAGVPVTGPVASASGLRRWTNYVIVAMPGLPPERLSSLVQDLGTRFAKVVVIPNAFGMTSVGVGTRDSGGLVGLYVRGHLSIRRNLMLKRAMDLVLLVPLGLVAVPVIALCAVAVMVCSPGNPFYAQDREGFGGRRIRLLKLRTMRLDADEVLRRHLAGNPAARAEWESRFKLEKDPRVIPVVGHVLRRLSFDELPQVVNIAKGELSFVGPRPFPYYHLDRFDPEFRRLRASVVPGLTGYWQVTSRSTADLSEQMMLDSYYICNWSLWLDLYVLARTPWAVIFGVGAY